jgi:peptidoglycan biosynthesis protein MviN/MurJ (putative lipid II flippase)
MVSRGGCLYSSLFLRAGISDRRLNDGFRFNARSYFSIPIPRTALMETSKAFLQAQSIFHPPTFIVAAILPLHTALAYFLVHRTPLRENGVAISVAMSYTLIGVLLVGWIARTEARDCWGGWSRRCLEGWRAYLGILVPSAMVSRSVLFIVCLSTPRYRRRFSDGKRWKVRSRRRRLIRMIAFVSLGDCV